METLTLACFWGATLLFVWSAWLNWRAYTRWRRKYEEILREDYLREFREEC